MAQTAKATNVTSTDSQPKRGSGLRISAGGSKTVFVYVEPASQLTTDYTFRIGMTMNSAGDPSSSQPQRVLYSKEDQKVVSGITAGASLIRTQESEGRWWEFSIPSGAVDAAVWLESTTGGGVNITLSGGR